MRTRKSRYALNNCLLHAAITAVLELGIKVGEEVQVASHDDVSRPWLPYMAGMPHFLEPTCQMGWEAARVLLQHVADPNGATVQMVLRSKFVPAG